MDELLDIIWFKIIDLFHYLTGLLNIILAPLNLLGPLPAIWVLALITVCFTKFFSRVYNTRRHCELKKELKYWFNIRQEALNCEDSEKGKALAKNIDQAKLNRVYYDYFFEGLLKSILTTYLPVLLMAAYVNEAFKPTRLITGFGRPYLLQFVQSNGEMITIGAVFWFVLSLIFTYIFWLILQKTHGRFIKKQLNPPDIDSIPADRNSREEANP
jgi:hypothetical protein